MVKKLFGRKSDKNNTSDEDEKYQFTTKKPTTKTCPYCGAKLEKIPNWKNGKMDCPHCERVIVVRSVKLFTEDEANVRDRLESINRTLLDFEITRQNFNSTRQRLSKEFSLRASVNDTVWRILNTINTPDRSYQNRKFIYLAMEEILRSEGKNTNDIMAKVHKMDLLEMKELNKNSGIKMVAKIHTANDEFVCDECRKLSEKVFTVDEALKTMPIPHRCTNENCRCGWGFELPDD